MDIPEKPLDFFTQYVPARFAEMKDALAGKTSSGSMTFHIGGTEQSWSFRVRDGGLLIEDGVQDDVVIQVTVPEKDFVAIVVDGARHHEGKVSDSVLAFRALNIEEEKVNMVRNVQGTVAFIITDDDEERRLAITPGKATPAIDAPDCRLECQMSDFIDMQTGKVQPMQLAMSGKLRMVGNVQIPMALSAVLA